MDGAVVDIDLTAAIRMAEIAGYDMPVVVELLSYGRAGLIQGINSRET